MLNERTEALDAGPPSTVLAKGGNGKAGPRSEYSYSRVQLALGSQLNSRLFKLSCELCDFANLGDGARTKLGAPEPEPNSGRRCPNQTPRGADTRGVAGHDACEVEVYSDGEVDARDDLDALAVLAVEH
eukprot:7253248-Prymnesium_polylepis.1